MLLKFAIADSIEDREFNNRSESNLKVFYEFCIENEVTNLEEVSHEHVKNFMIFRKNERGKPCALINTRLLRTDRSLIIVLNVSISLNHLSVERRDREKNQE